MWRAKQAQGVKAKEQEAAAAEREAKQAQVRVYLYLCVQCARRSTMQCARRSTVQCARRRHLTRGVGHLNGTLVHQVKAAERRRRKRHQLLSKRTAKGQPVTKHAIQDILRKLQAEVQA